MSDEQPMISVVIPIRNEERFIAQTIAYVQAQDYPRERMEILVVDGESDDRTVEIVSEIAANDDRVKLLRNPRRLSSAARNVGALAAKGEIITFIDGHTYIDNTQLLQNTARLMTEKNVEALSRPQFLETPENTEFQRAVALARRSAIGHVLD
ncbi:glycosyltransferase [candidate division GN15 bacterium]|nr:glycosyltransferase [candidate division GN15 bacterium]